MKAKIKPFWTSKVDPREILVMVSEAEVVAGKTVATIVMVIDAITMLVVVDVVVDTMAMVVDSKEANLVKEACTDKVIGIAKKKTTKRGAKSMNFVKR